MGPKEEENKETNTKEEETKEEKGVGEETGTTGEDSTEKVYDETYVENLKAIMEAEKAATVEATKRKLQTKLIPPAPFEPPVAP